MSLELALAALRNANRIDGTRASYRKDNPAEYLKVMDYLDGGPRPTVSSGMGIGLVLVEDARRGTSSPGGSKLRWAPPAQTSPTTISPGAGSGWFNLDDTKDYRLQIGDYEAPSGIEVIGGKSVVAIGGRITTTGISGQSSNLGLMLWPRNSSRYHFEGIRIRPHPTTNGGTNLHDGIVLRHTTAAPVPSTARVVLQNMLVGPTCIKIGYTPANGHADFIQWQSNFPAQVWMDKVTSLFDYNGLMLSNFITGGLEAHRLNFVPTDASPAGFADLFIYQDQPNPVTFDDVWGVAPPGSTFVQAFHPQSLAALATEGIPPGGDFVKEVDCGVGYISPGYP